MPELTYLRHVERVTIRRVDPYAVEVRFGRKQARLDSFRWSESTFVPEVAASLADAGMRRWWEGLVSSLRKSPPRDQETMLPVLELDVAGDLAALNWDQACWFAIGSRESLTVVRRCAVPSRAVDWPLALPLRILQVGTGLSPIADRAATLFNWHAESRDLVLATASCSQYAVFDWWAESGWASVDVCEVTVSGGASSLSAADSKVPGTVAWLERLSHDVRLRLLVLVAAGGHPDAVATARLIARRLTDRGGPAVLVAGEAAEELSHDFYQDLVHDRPLEWPLSSEGTVRYLGHAAGAAVFTDPARAEALRVSSVFRSIVDATEALVGDRHQRSHDELLTDQLSYLADHSPAPSSSWLRRSWGKAGTAFLSTWATASWNLHESEGVVPMQKAVIQLRDQLRVPEPLDVRASEVFETARQSQNLIATPRLSQVGDDGTTRPIPQLGGEIARHQPVVVGIGIGPYDAMVAVAGAVALLQEAVFTRSDREGAWLDVALMGLDCDVTGEPVQPLWVPRNEPSEQARFVVLPGRRKSWRVRLCLYRDNLLLQAILVAGVSGAEVPAHRRQLLARKLVMASADVPEGATWFARTEYTLTADTFADLPERPTRRVLAIAANSLDDERRLMFKGADLKADVRLDDDLDEMVQLVRTTLADVATPPIPGVIHHDDLLYGFNDDNSARDGVDPTGLVALATRGWQLYEKLVPQQSRDTIQAYLTSTGGVVDGSILSVAHLLVDKVIPWSLVYDRELDPDSGRPLRACRALREDNELPDHCGELDSCPLSAFRQKQQTDRGNDPADESTVACPRHFWGFRHIVELPVSRSGAVTSTTGGTGPIMAGFGQHHDLGLATTHLADLAGRINHGAAPVPWTRGNRNEFRTALKTQLDLDLVYVYCHAGYDRGREVLRLKDATDKVEGKLAAANLAGQTFRVQPLIFINGCRTAGFSPKTLSPFIRTLVSDRNASGLIGTEIDVWEQLASEVGKEIVDRLCNQHGMTAGQALRETRLALLAKGNPLGLAYTLYALADLRLR